MKIVPVLDAVVEMGVPLDRLLVGTTPGTVPQGPSGRWVIFPLEDGSACLGGMDRGMFAPYGSYADEDALREALRHVFLTPVEEVDLDVPPLVAQAQSLARRLKDRPAGSLTADDVPVGTALDRIGPDSGCCLFLLGTPFHERSSPPTDVQLERRGYLLRRPLPASARVSPVVPWFGQPGGGVMVTLDRPVRWYCDTGLVDAFAPG